MQGGTEFWDGVGKTLGLYKAYCEVLERGTQGKRIKLSHETASIRKQGVNREDKRPQRSWILEVHANIQVTQLSVFVRRLCVYCATLASE